MKLRAFLLLWVVGSIVWPGTATAATAEIRLPTPADVPTDLLGLLPGHFPSRIPARGGSVTESEVVTVGLGDDGSILEITAEQTIEIRGVGDYTLEISGPASNVEALPGSQASPGLRNGAIIWEGFSPGKRTLAARITMDITAPRFTPLPLTFSVRAGRLRIENSTLKVEPFGTGAADPEVLAAAIDATRRALAAGRLPSPGTGGIPRAVPVAGIAGTVARPVVVPMRLRGTIGGRAIDEVLAERPVEVQAAPASGIRLEAEPALPEASALGSVDLSSPAGRARALESLQRVLWQSALISSSGYLGIPVQGVVHARYIYGPPAVVVLPPPRTRPEQRPRPLAIAAASGLLLAAGTAGWRWWATH